MLILARICCRGKSVILVSLQTWKELRTFTVSQSPAAWDSESHFKKDGVSCETNAVSRKAALDGVTRDDFFQGLNNTGPSGHFDSLPGFKCTHFYIFTFTQ